MAAPPPAELPSAVASGTGATSILNAGVMTQIGAENAAAKFLFDPIYDDHFGSLEPLDDALIDKIVKGEAPYDAVTAVFVTHAHDDHFSAKYMTEMLAYQPDLKLVAPAQALDQLRKEAGWNFGLETQVRAITLRNGEQSRAFEIDGVEVVAMRSPHTGWPDRHSDVHNITYRVSAPTSDNQYMRVMHFGDADPARKHFTDHAEFLSSARTGLAIVPYWHFGTANPDKLFDETFNAETTVGMHVPANVPEWLAGSDRAYFTGEGQTADIPETD